MAWVERSRRGLAFTLAACDGRSTGSARQGLPDSSRCRACGVAGNCRQSQLTFHDVGSTGQPARCRWPAGRLRCCFRCWRYRPCGQRRAMQRGPLCHACPRCIAIWLAWVIGRRPACCRLACCRCNRCCCFRRRPRTPWEGGPEGSRLWPCCTQGGLQRRAVLQQRLGRCLATLCGGGTDMVGVVTGAGDLAETSS